MHVLNYQTMAALVGSIYHQHHQLQLLNVEVVLAQSQVMDIQT